MKTKHLNAMIAIVVTALLAVIAWNALEQIAQRQAQADQAARLAQQIKDREAQARREEMAMIEKDIADYERQQKERAEGDAKRQALREHTALVSRLLTEAKALAFTICTQEMDKLPTQASEEKLATVVATLTRLKEPEAAAAAASRNPTKMAEFITSTLDQRISAALDP
jgi:type II secretory pathway component PulJ